MASDTLYKLPAEKRTWFNDRLLTWFAEHQRQLPWRESTDPYRVWISEIMLQQTQVDRVIDYYRRFLGRFPDLDRLADAEWEEVLDYWRGLGYYNRGRRLIEAARRIRDDFGGSFPRDAKTLASLPGIGPYTAGAILSFAFNLPSPAMDTNGYRILNRVFSTQNIESPKKHEKTWRELASRLIPEGGSRDFHSALMDFGSLVCTAKAPLCTACVLAEGCNAYRRDDVELRTSSTGRSDNRLPSQMLATGKPVHEVAVAIIRNEGQVLLSRRQEGRHLAGLWEFPGGKREAGESWRECLKREIMEELGIEISVRPVWRVKHFEYDDRIVSLRFYRCSLLKGLPQPNEGQEIRWVGQKDLDAYEFPEANGDIVQELLTGR